MIRDVLTLIKTYFEIIGLKKGPDAIPYSPLLLALVFYAWLAVSLVLSLLIGAGDGSGFFITLLLNGIALGIYAAIIVLSGKASRLVQTFTALLGCWLLFVLSVVVGHVWLTPLLGQNPAALVSYLIFLWSVPVEGHIIARTINRPWHVGLFIAIMVFLVQIGLSLVFEPVDTVAG